MTMDQSKIQSLTENYHHHHILSMLDDVKQKVTISFQEDLILRYPNHPMVRAMVAKRAIRRLLRTSMMMGLSRMITIRVILTMTDQKVRDAIVEVFLNVRMRLKEQKRCLMKICKEMEKVMEIGQDT